MRKIFSWLCGAAVMLTGIWLLLRQNPGQGTAWQDNSPKVMTENRTGGAASPARGRFHARQVPFDRRERDPLAPDRAALERMHVAFAGLQLDPESSVHLSNLVLVGTARRIERLQPYTAREITEMERRDIAGSSVFLDPHGMEFRQVLEKHGLGGSRLDHLHRLAMEINFTWNRMASSPFVEEDGPAEIREYMRLRHAASAARAEALRAGFLTLARECFAGLNVDVDTLLQDILALPEPPSPPPFHWPGE